MFNHFSRVRLMLRDSADDQTENTHVLVRQRTGWVMLLAAFLALLSLPAHRGFMSDQAMRALARKKPGWMTAAFGEPGSARERLMSTAQQSPGERDLQLGAVHLRATALQAAAGPDDPTARIGFLDPQVEAADALRARFPNDPVPIAHVIRLCWVRGGTLDRKAPEAYNVGRLLPSDLARMEALCREGAKLDPANGYFPTMLATVQFARLRDAEALNALHDASVCDTWEDYAYQQGTGARDLLIRSFGDRGLIMHALPSAAILLSHLRPIRQSAMLAVSAADKARASGDLQLEHRTRTDVIRLGSLMRRNADTLIGRLFGASVEDFGFGAEGDADGLLSTKPPTARAAGDRAAYAARLRAEAPALYAEVDRELSSLDRFLVVKQQYLSGSTPFQAWDQVILMDMGRDSLGLTLLPNLAASLLLWLLAALAITAYRPRGSSRSGRAWSRAGAAIAGLGLLGLGAIKLAAQDPVVGSLLGALGLGLALAASLPNGAPEQHRGWSPLTLVLALGLTGAVCTAAAFSGDLSRSWSAMLPAYWLLGGEQAVELSSPPVILLTTGALVSVSIPLIFLAVAALRRRTLREALDGMRLAFKSAAVIAAGLYLVYVLIAVPAAARDARTWEKSLAKEMQGQPL